MNITGAADCCRENVMNFQFSVQEDKRLSDIFSQMVQDKKEEFYEKVKTGTFEPSFAIGAGHFTEKEWDKLLESFDVVQEALREAADMEDHQKKSESAADGEEDDVQPKNMDMLMADYMTCVVPSEDPDKEDEVYIIVYDLNGMRCLNKKTRQVEWAIKFTDDTQYDKLRARLSEIVSGESTAFACQESCWRDFYQEG